MYCAEHGGSMWTVRSTEGAFKVHSIFPLDPIASSQKRGRHAPRRECTFEQHPSSRDNRIPMLSSTSRPSGRLLACCSTVLRPSAGYINNEARAAGPWITRRTQASVASEHDEAPSSQPSRSDEAAESPRRPRSLHALYLQPLKRDAEYGIPSCDLQLRSFSVQPLEFFADFALRAAYYLGLPAYGPIPLPRITERWTVPRSHFIFKKSQENFERITLRRMIQIKDGNPESVQLWLAYLRKHQYYGVGMKANVWEFGKAEPGRAMDLPKEEVSSLESTWSHLGQLKGIGAPQEVEGLLSRSRSLDSFGMVKPRAAVK
ncbi:hypothetical protein HIM_04436 [Hirsutella minnesotensis 3608]|uniref:Small ribosomal subunit protein uS10m n=1 Tax=Hirsutella minnesotensis 3608 TaxID=1043627 RepID=A0A0F7ZPR9_9HYPO|nr:hypothetical protein HIM_04436 [Hirsutella minnesotensis 3608]